MFDSLLRLTHFLQARARKRFLSSDRLHAWQLRRARQLVRFANDRCPHYCEWWKGHDLADPWSLPTIDKRAMIEHFDGLNSLGVTREDALRTAEQFEDARAARGAKSRWIAGLSSGTSGRRGLFLLTPAEIGRWSATIASRLLPPLQRGGFNIALFLRANSPLYESLDRGFVRFRYFPLDLSIEEIVAQLEAFEPDVLAGPTSLLLSLIDENDKLRLRRAPRSVISVAEVLADDDAQRIARATGAPPLQIYQCTEGLLAASCPRGTLHIQEDLVALQFQPLPSFDGIARCTPIITDLWRRTQPIIRYALDDVLIRSDALCTCGWTFRTIRRVAGRLADTFHFTAQDGSLRPVYADALTDAMLSVPGLREFELVQRKPGQIDVGIECETNASIDALKPAIEKALKQCVATSDCRIESITVKPGLHPRRPTEKRRRIRNEIDRTSASIAGSGNG